MFSGTLHSRDEIKDTGRASLIRDRVRAIIKAYSSSTTGRRVLASDVIQAFEYDPTKFSKKLNDGVLSGMYVTMDSVSTSVTI